MEPDESTTNGRSPACDEMKALLSAYLDGELSRDERIRADTHAVGCRSCRDLIERAEELDRRIREEHRFDPGEVDTLDMQARVLAQIGSRIAKVKLPTPGFEGIREIVSRQEG